MKEIELALPSLRHTEALGERLGRLVRPGDVITLSGELGAGKTTLTQAIGKGVEVPDTCYITSPTFSLVHEYPGRIPLFHLDLYRLSGVEELEMLGFEEFFYGEGFCVIEWPDRLGSLMPASRLEVELKIVDTEARNATLRFLGESWEERLEALIAPLE